MWSFIFTVFSSAILFSYYLYHPNYFEIFFTNHYFWTMVIGLGLCGWLVGGWYYSLKNYFIVRRSSIIALFVAGVILLGNLFYFSLNIYELENWFKANFFIIKDIGLVSLEYFLIVMGGYLYGDFIQKKLFKKEGTKITDFKFWLNVVLGISCQIGLLWILGLLTILNWWASLIVLLLPFVFNIQSLIAVWKDYWQVEIKAKLSPIGLVSLTILVFFVGVNFWEVYRPIPIGWDDMGVYINIPNLLGQNGTLMTGFQAYNWGLLESIGFTIFRADTFALFISFLWWLLAIGALFSFLKKYSNSSISLLVITLFYTSPAIVFQSSKDMKVDLALFFLAVMIFWLITKWMKLKDNYYLILAGILTGVAFGVKYTIFLFFISVIVFIAYNLFAIWGVLVGLAIGNFMVAYLKLLRYGGIEISADSYQWWQWLAGLVFVVVLVVLLIKEFKNQEIFWWKLKTFFLYPLLTFLFFSPWMVYNYHSVYGWDLSWQKITNISVLTNGKQVGPRLDYKKLSALNIDANNLFEEYLTDNQSGPEDKGITFLNKNEEVLAVKEINFTSFDKVQAKDLRDWLQKQVSTGNNEELGRYIGYEDNFWIRYLSLPWKVTINKVVKGQYVDITAVWLIFGVGAVGFIGWLVFGKKEEEENQKLLKASLLLGIVYLVLWIFIGSGIFWYGIAGFSVLLFLINYFLSKNKDSFQLKSANIYLYSGVGLLLVAIFGWYLQSVQQEIVNRSAQYALVEKSGKETRLTTEWLTSFLDDLAWGSFLDFRKVNGKTKWTEQRVSQGVVAFPTIIFSRGTYWLILIVLFGLTTWHSRYKKQGILIVLSVVLIGNCLYRVQVKPHPNFMAFALGGLNIEESITGKKGVECKKFSSCNEKTKEIGGLFPGYLQASEILNKAIAEGKVSNQAPIYRVGTFIRYFLQKNNEILIEDSLIDKFNYLSSDGDYDKTFARLKKLGINFMIIDLFTPTIDKTPEKSLTAKFKNLIEFVEEMTKSGKMKIHVQNKRHGLLLVELLD